MASGAAVWWRRKWLLAGILFFLVALIGLVPSYRAFKVWRGRMLAEQAREYADRGAENLQKAWERASSAYFLAPEDLKVLRTLAEVYGRSDPGLALPLWQEAARRSGGASEDRRGLVDAALNLRNLGLAEEHLDSLLREAPTDWRVLELQARRLWIAMDPRGAMESLKPILADPGTPESTHSLYLQISQQSREPTLQLQGLSHVETLARRDDEVGIKALRLLLPILERNTDLAEFTKRRIGSHPDAERNDHLHLLSRQIQIGAKPGGEAALQARKLFDLGKPGEQADYARWLNQNGLAPLAEEVIPLQAALQRQDLFLVLLDAMALQGKWQGILEVLEQRDLPLENYLRHLFQARAYRETGLERRAQLGWQRVRLEVANEPEKLGFFADYAHRLGLYEEARRAYDRMEQLPSSMRFAFQRRIELERSLHNTAGLRDTLERMAKVYPKDISVQNDLAYLNLLLQEHLEESVERAAELIDGNPSFFAHRITYSLAKLRLGEPEKALGIFEGWDIPVDELSSSWRVVFGAVLRQNGQHAQADAVFRGIDARFLLKEELAIFEKHAYRSDGFVD